MQVSSEVGGWDGGGVSMAGVWLTHLTRHPETVNRSNSFILRLQPQSVLKTPCVLFFGKETFIEIRAHSIPISFVF